MAPKVVNVFFRRPSYRTLFRWPLRRCQARGSFPVPPCLLAGLLRRVSVDVCGSLGCLAGVFRSLRARQATSGHPSSSRTSMTGVPGCSRSRARALCLLGDLGRGHLPHRVPLRAHSQLMVLRVFGSCSVHMENGILSLCTHRRICIYMSCVPLLL